MESREVPAEEVGSQELTVVSDKLKMSLRAHEIMDRAFEVLERSPYKRTFLPYVALQQAEMGDSEAALENLSTLPPASRLRPYNGIALIQKERGEDQKPVHDAAVSAVDEFLSENPGIRGLQNALQMIRGLIPLGLNNEVQRILTWTDSQGIPRVIFEGIIANAKTQQLEVNVPIDQPAETQALPRDFKSEIEAAQKIENSEEKANKLKDLGKAQAEAGENPTVTFREALKAARKTRDDKQSNLLFDITEAQAEAGLINEAIYNAENSSSNSVNLLARIAAVVGKKGLSPKNIQELSPVFIKILLAKSNDNRVLESLGYFNKVDASSLPSDLRSNVRVSLIAGVAKQTKEKELLTQARKIAMDEENRPTTKAFVAGVISQDYDTASSYLLGMLDDVSKQESPMAVSQATRLLKGLIEIDNPKGQTIATRLFADEKLPAGYREYLARKLFRKGYWDPMLGRYLQYDTNQTGERILRAVKNFHPDRSKQAKILSALIRDFGLTPDLPSYEFLEKPGVLQSETLEERVSELKQRTAEFKGKSRDELLELFRSDPDALKIFYLTQTGAYLYSIVNDYSLEKFQATIKRVSELKVHDPTLNRFMEALEADGLSVDEARKIVDEANQGKPLVSGETRSIRFSSTVEYGSQYEAALQRLQEVWTSELKSLLLSKTSGGSPETIGHSLQMLENHEWVSQEMPKLSRLIKPLRLDQEKINKDDIEAISKDFRRRLQQIHKGNKEELQRMRDLSDSETIYEYLKDNIPSTAAASEWLGHLRSTLSDLESSLGQTGPRSADKQLELTFLDKNEDFVRALRFADAAQCCFNASRENFRQRTYEYVTRLNKDPLSFMMDLKQVGSDEIQGFVFGRMGINPRNGRLIIMLNGVYSQLKGQAVVDNILKIIEERMGSRLKAESIVIASKYGGAISQPDGYTSVQRKRIEAVRALQNEDGTPETQTYDDIGLIANGPFSFEGYEKKIPRRRRQNRTT